MRPVVLYCFVVSFLLASASAQDAQQQQTAEITRQIAQLKHRSYRVRAAAVVKLGKIGLPALPLLLDVLGHPDLELATRAKQAVRLICAARSATPVPTGKRLTLRVREMDAKLAVAILSKTTGYTVTLGRDTPNRQIKLDLRNAPLFAALRAICKTGRYGYSTGYPDGMVLSDGALEAYPTVVSGPFMLKLTAVERYWDVDFQRPSTRGTTVSIDLVWESRARLLGVRGFQVERALDILGNDLRLRGKIAGAEFREVMTVDLGYGWEQIQQDPFGQVGLAWISERASSISRLTGHLRVVVADELGLVRIPVSAKGAQRRRVFKGGYYELISLRRMGDQLVVKTGGRVPEFKLGEWKEGFYQQCLFLETGAPLTFNRSSGRWLKDRRGWIHRNVYHLEADDKVQAIGMTYVRRIGTRKVPFDFKNVSLK